MLWAWPQREKRIIASCHLLGKIKKTNNNDASGNNIIVTNNNIAVLIVVRRWIFSCDESDNKTSEAKEGDPTKQQPTDKVLVNLIKTTV